MEQFNLNIYEQYIGTNIDKLLNGKNEISSFFILNALKTLKNDVMDLRTASGDALDMWGKLLGFSRYIPIPSQSDTEEYELLYNDFLFNSTNFVNLKFANSLDIEYSMLDDRAYRLVLQLIYQGRNLILNMDNIAKLVSAIIDAEITIRDNFNMSYNVYYKKNNLDRWLQFVISKFDIIPRPAGIKIYFISSIWKVFGFRTDDEQYNLDKLTNFWNAQFEGGRLSGNFFADELMDLEDINRRFDEYKNIILNKENLLNTYDNKLLKINNGVTIDALNKLKKQIENKYKNAIQNNKILKLNNDNVDEKTFNQLLDGYTNLIEEIDNFLKDRQ